MNKHIKRKASILRQIRKAQHINPVRSMCEHLLGEHHTLGHRLVVGFVVIMVGVGLAQSAHHISTVWAVTYLIDATGYGLHGVGLMPYLELIQNWRNHNDNGRESETVSESQRDSSDTTSNGDANL